MTAHIYKGDDGLWHINQDHAKNCTEVIKIGHNGREFLPEPDKSELCKECFRFLFMKDR